MSRRFSVIIVHRNGAEMLLKTLAAVYAACDPAQDEIFVVDNGSNDDSAGRVAGAYPDVRLVRNPCNNGFARANNQAIALAQGRLLLLLNSDALLAPGALGRLERHFDTHPRAGLIGGRLVGPDGSAQNSGHRFPSFLGELGLARHKTPGPVRVDGQLAEYDWIVGACMAARRTAVDQAGALDPDFFFYYEDIEWNLRLHRHGWRTFVAQDVEVVHLRGQATRAVRREALVEELRSRLIYYRKAFPRPAAVTLILHRVVRLALKAVLWGAAVVMTLGRLDRIRRRALRYLHPMAWVLAGMPGGWGLPDKCPYPMGRGAEVPS